MFGSTLVVKIKKTQESTPSVLKRITEDKENIVLPPVVSPLSPPGTIYVTTHKVTKSRTLTHWHTVSEHAHTGREL